MAWNVWPHAVVMALRDGWSASKGRGIQSSTASRMVSCIMGHSASAGGSWICTQRLCLLGFTAR